jgi:predicted nucleic acid-binding protein
VIAWGEYLCGPVSDAERLVYEELLGAPIAFVPAASEVAAHLFNVSGRRRGTFTDCLVAASAIVEGAELVTVNTAHFVRMVPVGLRLVELDAE